MISSLKLVHFRSYQSAALSELERGIVVLYGANGAGKTNVLEAISLLVPGRGLRTATATEMQCRDAGQPWAIMADMPDAYGQMRIATGLDPKKNKRIAKVNGEQLRALSSLSDYCACIWLTPQMDRLFLDSSRERRRFLDRLIFGYDPGHAGRLIRYENAMRQRTKLLQEGPADPAWLDGLEAQMSETGVAIGAARLAYIDRLQRAGHNTKDNPFPLARLSVSGTIESLLENAPALEAEEMFLYQLKETRDKDAQTGGAATGPHKSDLLARYPDKDMPADQCSTGEQKALLIGIVLADARLVKAEQGRPPMILLDEVAAHLDENRRAMLYDLLAEMGGQVWLTGTDRNLFNAIENRARFIEVSPGQLGSG